MSSGKRHKDSGHCARKKEALSGGPADQGIAGRMFDKECLAAAAGRAARARYVTMLRSTPKPYISLGFPDVPWRHVASKIRKEVRPKSEGGHGLGTGVMHRLPAAMTRPVAVFRSCGRWGIVTDLLDGDGLPVLVIAEVRDDFVAVVTAYGVDNAAEHVVSAERDGNLRYCRGKRLARLAGARDGAKPLPEPVFSSDGVYPGSPPSGAPEAVDAWFTEHRYDVLGGLVPAAAFVDGASERMRPLMNRGLPAAAAARAVVPEMLRELYGGFPAQ